MAHQGLKVLKRYLHLKAAHGSSPWHTLPVIVVGPEGSGKTTLLAKLRGEDLAGIERARGLQVSEQVSPCMYIGLDYDVRHTFCNICQSCNCIHNVPIFVNTLAYMYTAAFIYRAMAPGYFVP